MGISQHDGPRGLTLKHRVYLEAKVSYQVGTYGQDWLKGLTGATGTLGSSGNKGKLSCSKV